MKGTHSLMIQSAHLKYEMEFCRNITVLQGNRFISSVDFARTIKNSSNYYVIITREALDALPYSVTEIYGIHSSGKYNSKEPIYHSMYRIYGDTDELESNGAENIVI